jgi:hypothetical protein
VVVAVFETAFDFDLLSLDLFVVLIATAAAAIIYIPKK